MNPMETLDPRPFRPELVGGHGDGLILKPPFHGRRSALLNDLQICGKLKNREKARRMHDLALREGLIPNDARIASSLIATYAKCGMLEEARSVFDSLPARRRNIVAWNALACGYAQNGCGEEALECFRRIKEEEEEDDDDVDGGVSCPDEVTYTCVLKACGIVGSLEIGEAVDAEIRGRGMLRGDDVALGNALVDMYCKCGALGKARMVFDELRVRNVVTWTALISGYAQHGRGKEALECFDRMKEEDGGVLPNAITYVCVLDACGIVGSLDLGRCIAMEMQKRGLCWESNVMLGTALVDMYCKCGAMGSAGDAFGRLSIRNTLSWSALIGGYARHGLAEEALECYKQMSNENHEAEAAASPNAVTYTCALKACGIVGALLMGGEIDNELRMRGMMEKGDDVVLGNALLDMYCKCGALEQARAVFDELRLRNVVTWSALLNGHAQLGEIGMALHLFRSMIAERIMPNAVTFTALLMACSHAGMVEEGGSLFDELCIVYGQDPTPEHCTCMVDLFGRAGYFRGMQAWLEKLPQYRPALLTLLGACRKWSNVELGRWAFRQALQLDDRCSAVYVCMQHIYDGVGM